MQQQHTTYQMQDATSTSRDDDDEDRMFLLSLLPSFKKLNHENKLGVRIDILQVIRQSLIDKNNAPELV